MNWPLGTHCLRTALVAVCLMLCGFTARSAPAGENWPQWRGPDANGTSDSTGLPSEWSLDKNIVWKTPLPAWSGCTPIIWGDRIFVMSPSADDKPQAAPPEGGRRGGGGAARDPGGQELSVWCISKKDGTTLWRKEVDAGNRLYRKGNSTSPSPVTNGERVWVLTGNGVITCFDMDGNQKWTRNLQTDYGKFGLNWGYASSPLLDGDQVYVQVLHGNNTDDPSYLVALDALTGAPKWRVERPTDAIAESPDAYTTPALVQVNGRKEIVVTGGDYVTGHDPATGKELWRAAGLNPRKDRAYRIIASPVVFGEMIFAPTRKKPLLALKAGGTGDISTSHLAWLYDGNGGPDVPSPVSDGERFYMVDDAGVATCVDAKTGAVIWGPQRTVSGTVSSSPLLADGKIYITNETADTMVIASGPEFKKIGTGSLDGAYTLSSIAVSGQQLFIRTGTHLYCVGEKR